MSKEISSGNKAALIERVQKLMELSGLELPGFAEYIGVSESHIYSILNGTRELSRFVQIAICNRFNLSDEELRRPDFQLDYRVVNQESLNKFYDNNEGVVSYFMQTRAERKPAYFIENVLLRTPLFDKPVYVSDVRAACKEYGKDFDSKTISQVLDYLVKTKKLKSKKKRIRLTSGQAGERSVKVFFK